MIDRAVFFGRIRLALFTVRLREDQVRGMEIILAEWERRGLTDLRWLAYMLATAFHETAATMQPIAEYGRGKGKTYGLPDAVTGQTYYGRGFVQLTWKSNYDAMAKITGVDLVNKPDLAMRPDIAATIMFEGMQRGTFTGKKLSDYFAGTKADWAEARRIINGTDRAALIAGYGKTFLAALTAAEKPQDSPKSSPAPVQPPHPQSAPASQSGGWLTAIVRIIASIFKR